MRAKEDGARRRMTLFFEQLEIGGFAGVLDSGIESIGIYEAGDGGYVRIGTNYLF